MLGGYDDEVAWYFSLPLILTQIHATIIVRGLSIELIHEITSRVTTLPLGVLWTREDRGDSQISKNKIFLEGEELIEEKKWIKESKTAIYLEWGELPPYRTHIMWG